MRLTKILGVLAAFLLVAIPAYAQEYGTPAEAKAMLEKAVAALKVDRAKALQMFTKGEGGFREKGIALGANDYVTKPFSTRDLTEKVKQILDSLT